MPRIQATPRSARFPSALAALRAHWPLYLMEAAELALFMLAACYATVLLFGLTSFATPWPAKAKRLLMALAMGLTAIAIIKSPWGQRSGAQFNPAITCVFYRLGKIGPYDAVFYIAAHFLGAIFGVALASVLLGPALAAPSVDYAVTIPGPAGPFAAFAVETFMSALLMTTVLVTSGRPRLAPLTTWLVGLLITAYVFFFAAISGFSINPARTLGSAVIAHVYTSLWIYFTAPLLGMFLAAEAYLRLAATPHTRHYLTHRHLTQRNGQTRTTAP